MGFYSFSLGMRFFCVTLALVISVKPVFLVASDKQDQLLRYLCTTISSGVSSSNWVIMFDPFFIFFLNIFLIKWCNKRCIKLCVLIFNIIFKKFFIEFWMNSRKYRFKNPLSSLNHTVDPLEWPSNLSKPFLWIVITEFFISTSTFVNILCRWFLLQ